MEGKVREGQEREKERKAKEREGREREGAGRGSGNVVRASSTHNSLAGLLPNPYLFPITVSSPPFVPTLPWRGSSLQPQHNHARMHTS